MQPDKPQLCRFWLAGLVSALCEATKRKNLSSVIHPMTMLIDFLWRYTWAAVPKPLRKPLLRAIDGTSKLMQCGMIDFSPTNSSASDHAPLVGMVLRWVMRSDPVFRRWHLDAMGRDADSRPVQASGLKFDGETMMRCASMPMPSLYVRTSMSSNVVRTTPQAPKCRVMLSTILVIDMICEASVAFDHGAIDPNTASLAMLIYPRGAGLATSAFGWLAAPQDLALLAETLRATTEPGAPLELVRKHYVFSHRVCPYGKSPGPPEPRPGFGVMPADCETSWSALPTAFFEKVCSAQSSSIYAGVCVSVLLEIEFAEPVEMSCVTTEARHLDRLGQLGE